MTAAALPPDTGTRRGSRESSPNGTDPPKGVKSAERALTILELLTSSERPLSFTTLAEALGYPRSSLHGLLQTLLDKGWIEFDERDRTYRLGIRTLEAGNVCSRRLGLTERALPLMERITEALDETCQLAVLDELSCVYVAKVDGRQTLTLASEVGRRLPAHATGVGKVLLAGLTPDDLADRLRGQRLRRFTAHTIADGPRLGAHLSDVRRRGFAVDNEEHTPGVRCIAVPVFDHTRRVVAALSVSTPAIRATVANRERARSLLLEASTRLSHELGYAGPTTTPRTVGDAR